MRSLYEALRVLSSIVCLASFCYGRRLRVAQSKSLDEIKSTLGGSTAPPKRNAQANPPPPITTEIIYIYQNDDDRSVCGQS